MSKATGTGMRVVKWTLGIVVALALLVAAWMWWVVERFDTETLPPRHGQVDVELFARDGGKRPLIVGLGGGEGGNAWASARWTPQRERFLDQGYALLALGYFGTPNSPETLDRISLDGVHAAIVEAGKDPRVDGRCVAIIGGSRGAELALLLASHYPDIDAVVAIVPGSAVFPALTDAMTTGGFSLHDKPLPFVPMTWGATPYLLVGDLRGAFETIMQDRAAMQRAAIAVENINGPIQFVSASRDEMWPSKEMADAMMLRLKAKGFRHPVEHLVVQGGHGEPLDEFPKMEAFLDTHFKQACP
ncbi:MAG TPA: acyl-CoA thioester hydrolase/BAAT C-terminal domain-containing protein [Thermomonas sp.]|uniref:acyl-CoA thioester hydrolase/BAAT C-terminal domain-containing protein n=1 Tax=Thermomonas sp. TaxID=1971895 RepID=UPI002BB8F495|nr:acyl-CoA thioester hydrolase/BAAT C-terminal domain-containing protein [Thermomonas sp.]HPM56275.1 acyl-CoA thioester hydrolase/BAAT C-terminal domain-containing protein [Thermomonas sp.]HPW12334.1 acyl-CoA thioester hydrolase/BAAT C-terminal domain-containing protein [Thermomonas sp.]